jgi:hypothetical protein
MAPSVACREIDLPAAWERLIAEAEMSLGAHGAACRM